MLCLFRVVLPGSDLIVPGRAGAKLPVEQGNMLALRLDFSMKACVAWLERPVWCQRSVNKAMWRQCN